MAALECTEAAYCTASGMSAITAVLLHLVGAGGHVVASQCLYGGTHALLSRFVFTILQKNVYISFEANFDIQQTTSVGNK